MNTLTRLTFLFGLLLTSSFVSAQEDLNIESLFNDYGKKEGSVLIELAKDVLGNHTRISHYKSLIFSPSSEAVKEVEDAIQKDIEYGSKLMESKKDGKLEAAYYYLGKEENASFHEYILYKNKSGKVTLIYVKGKFPPEQLEKELGKLKDLFIKVNNKRIKL